MKELMYIPGDLVIFKIPFEPHGNKVGIIKFCGNFSDLLSLGLYEDMRSEYFIKLEDIQGIPLTPEILEKNEWKRFVYDDDIFHEIELNCYSTLVVYFPQKDKKDISCGIFTDDLQGGKIISFFPTEIKYVHQLQHLLFGLGLDSSLKV